MAYIEQVLDLIQEHGLSFALGRVLEEVTEGALSDDDEDRASHMKCAAYFLKRQLAHDGEESETPEEAMPAPGKRNVGGKGKRAGKRSHESSEAWNPIKPQRQCEVCDAFKGLTAFETNGRRCRKCRKAAA